MLILQTRSFPVKQSFSGGVPVAEAGLAPMESTATKFVTYADYWTGVAYVNYALSNSITFTARDMSGAVMATKTISILGGKHGAENVGPMLGLQNGFKGSITVTATEPILPSL